MEFVGLIVALIMNTKANAMTVRIETLLILNPILMSLL